jgi:hypothetical protein
MVMVMTKQIWAVHGIERSVEEGVREEVRERE